MIHTKLYILLTLFFEMKILRLIFLADMKMSTQFWGAPNFTTAPLAIRAEPVMGDRVLAQMEGDKHHSKRYTVLSKRTGKIFRMQIERHKASSICQWCWIIRKQHEGFESFCGQSLDEPWSGFLGFFLYCYWFLYWEQDRRLERATPFHCSWSIFSKQWSLFLREEWRQGMFCNGHLHIHYSLGNAHFLLLFFILVYERESVFIDRSIIRVIFLIF